MASPMGSLAGAPIPHDTLSVLPRIIIPATILCALGLLTYILRIHSRIRSSTRLKWDDHAMTLAVLLALTYYALTVANTVLAGSGSVQNMTLQKLSKTLKLGFVCQIIWTWAVSSIKMSVSLMMLRIKKEIFWRRALFALMGIILFNAIGYTISILVSCRPLKAQWDIMLLIKPGVCVSRQTTFRILWAATALFGFTDVVCALLPLAFIVRIKRPFREKMVLAFLMALGLLAAVCSIVKTTLTERVGQALFSGFKNSKGPVCDGANATIWSYAEVFIGIIAANIPCLRSYLQSAFRAFGGHVSNLVTPTDSKADASGTKNSGMGYTLGRQTGVSTTSQTDTVDLMKCEDGKIVVKHDLELSTVDRSSEDDELNSRERYHEVLRGHSMCSAGRSR